MVMYASRMATMNATRATAHSQFEAIPSETRADMTNGATIPEMAMNPRKWRTDTIIYDTIGRTNRMNKRARHEVSDRKISKNRERRKERREGGSRGGRTEIDDTSAPRPLKQKAANAVPTRAVKRESQRKGRPSRKKGRRRTPKKKKAAEKNMKNQEIHVSKQNR
jgi:hypothetical protein